jgi:Tfp pilus assembly protein PilN
MVALAVVAAAAVGAWSYMVNEQITKLGKDRDRLRIENTRLQALRKQVVEYEKMKQLQQSRIEVIQGLRDSQTGPVLLLNHVLQSIPRESNIWLTVLDQKGDRVQITGYAHHSEAIPDLMSNLSSSGVFRSVDLENLEQEKEAAKFSLVCVAATRKVSTE